MGQVITNAFEHYWQSSLAAEQPVVLDEFVLADIPNLDITAPIDPDTGLPPAGQIVHRQTVDQRGRVNSNAVAYSIVMDTTVGDFSFNAMFLRNKANGVIGMIVYKGRETKLKTDQTTGQTGNSLVKSMLMGYDQAAEATLTNVDAGTWQIDYAARLRGQDEDLRQLASQLYGHHTFIGDGFKVVQQDGAHQVTPGVAIVGGLRIELKQPEVIYPGTKPIGVWVDVHRAGSLLSEHQNHVTIITSVADLTDHVDGSGYQHYVAKLATVQADNTVVDGRGQDGGSGAGGIPDTFALWKRSMAEAGYNLVAGSFEQGGMLTSAVDVLLHMATGVAYTGAGPFPQDVPKGTNPASGGFVARHTEILRAHLTGDAGASLVGAGNGMSVQDSLDRLAATAVTDTDSLYRYKKIKTLPLAPPLVASIVAENGYGYMYPQSFSYDPAGNIYINFVANVGGLWVVKFDLSGAAVSAFKVDSPTHSEMAEVYEEDGILKYAAAEKGVLAIYDITNLPLGQSVQHPILIQNPDADYGGCRFGKGKFLIDERANALGVTNQRSRMFVHNTLTNKREQAVELPYSVVGPVGSAPYASLMQKVQGFAADSNNIYVSSGAYSSTPSEDLHYATGLSRLTLLGDLVGTGLIKSSYFMQYMTNLGLAVTRCENEGVAIGPDGLPHLLHIYQSAIPTTTTEGILISSVGDPYDFVDLRAGAIAPLAATGHGKSQDGLMNPYTGEVMDTLQKIFAYMQAADIQEYSFYSTSQPVLDLDGSVIPPTMLVKVYNPCNATMFYETIGFGSQTWWTGAVDSTTKNHVTYAGPTPDRNLANTLGGDRAGRKLTTASGATHIGSQAGQENTTGANTNYGQNAGRDATTATNQTNVGRGAGRFQIDGITANNFDTSTCIGLNSYVSGPNQVQLGGSGTTPYAYAALQIRSDERDKDDKVKIEGDLAVAFVRGLTSWFYKLDLRDDYVEEYEEQVGEDEEGNPIFDIFTRPIPKDGSKIRTRNHAGYLAQEVKVLMDTLGIDFGMYQDHLVNGGCDVKTLAYEQTIPFLSKALDVAFERLGEQNKRMDAIEARLTDGGL